MTSGLYDLPGASATATAAAWAKRLDDPMTKFSKRYLGLSRASAAVPRLSGDDVGALRPAGDERVVILLVVELGELDVRLRPMVICRHVVLLT